MTDEKDVAIPKRMAFDEECLKLARYFCPHAPAQSLYQLAQDIQTLVEDSDAASHEEKHLGT
jgi:hypothetical protein